MSLLLQRTLFVLPIVLALFKVVAPQVVGGNQTNALLQWKASLDASSRVSLSSWNQSVSPCRWFRITCKASAGNHNTIVGVSLSSLTLNGTLHNFDFSSLPDLDTLDLRNNSLFGSVPSSIRYLSKLFHLDLSYNQLWGTIPTEIGMLSSIKRMLLGDNKLMGPIPPSIGNLSSLNILHLLNNELSGPIPKEIGKLANLFQLDLSNNRLSGSIPTTFGNVTHLTFLYLYMNSLSGFIPEEFGRTALVDLQLLKNDLTGSIPTSIGNLSSRLTILNLSKNNLSGTIPPQLNNLRQLTTLDLSDNDLSGSIPRNLSNLLMILSLRNNRLSGTIPPQLSSLRQLASLQLSDNSFTGQLPLNLCDNAWKIEKMGIDDNFLVGPISLKNCSRLVRARLEDNQFTGDITDVFGVHPQLNFLSLSNNKFYGKLTVNSTQFPNLTSFHISNNNLSGTISAELGDLTKLGQIDLSMNNFEGEIPGTLGKLSLLSELLLHGNQLSGYVPSSIGMIPGLQNLNVAYNNLKGLSVNQTGLYSGLLFLNMSSNSVWGNFPIELCNFLFLWSVDLSQNSLVGSIPKQIDNLQRLVTLNISHNNLSGSISSLGDLSSLVAIDVSYNQLEGPIPNVLAHRNATAQVFRNNRALCSNIVVGLNPCPPPVDQSRHKEGDNKTWLVVLLSSLAFALLLAFLVTLYFRSKMKKDIELQPEVINTSQNLFQIWSYDGRFVYENILESTEEFNSKYIIGVGAFATVYKAKLSTGQVVAIKKTHAMPGDETLRDKAFDSEIRALLEIRHRNIVKLYGFCSTPRNSFLVYEYFLSGSLESLLNNDEAVVRFGWLERVNVVKGVADALSYMHHDCSPPIIHRDISTKNILLDQDYEAHVSDFGTARFVKPDSSNWTSFAGTLGYAAPELAYMTKLNEKSDVYSFGIVALEVLLGQHPANVFSPLLSSFLDAVIGFDVPIKNVLDKRIPCPEKEVADLVISVLKIALSCLSESPESRLSMKRVSQGLSSGGGSMVPNMSMEMKVTQLGYWF